MKGQKDSRPFDLAVFDFDGTLVQSNALKSEGYDIIAARFDGGPPAMAEARRIPGADRFTVARRFAELLGLPAGAAEDIAADYTALVDDRVIAAPEVPGAEALLGRLRAAGLFVHLSSATPRVSLERVVAARGWSAHFDGIHGRPDTKPQTLRRLVDASGISPDRIVVIGDGEDDRDSALELSSGFIAVGDRLLSERRASLQDIAERLAP